MGQVIQRTEVGYPMVTNSDDCI